MRKRYKYILCGTVKESDKLSNFRLIEPSKMWYNATDVYGNTYKKLLGDSAIRVVIPDEVRLHKSSCGFSAADDCDITIGELGYDIVLYLDGKWTVFDKFSLKDYQPHEFFRVLEDEYGLHCTGDGYLTDDKYDEYVRRMDDEISQKIETKYTYLKQVADKHNSFDEYIAEVYSDKSRWFLIEESFSIIEQWCDKLGISDIDEFKKFNCILKNYANFANN